MPRYADIPTAQKFEDDSSVFFALRSSDKTIGQIDRLLADYQGASVTDKVDILYYLYLATKFWRKNIGAALKNTLPTGLTDPGNTLPSTGKVSGSEKRGDAVSALNAIVEEKLLKNFRIHDISALPDELAETYGCTNHEIANDQLWMRKYGADPAVTTVFLTDDGMRRRYKLRFRSGLAYRWKDASDTSSGYVKFDTNDNTEAEIDDKLCHFAMDRRGRIYIGFNKRAEWFKHSSLLGGEDALAAGRMKVDQGKVSFVANDSGHYQPEARHMVNLLQRLSIYGADLTNMTIQRMSDKARFPAVDVLNKISAWPDGQTGW